MPAAAPPAWNPFGRVITPNGFFNSIPLFGCRKEQKKREPAAGFPLLVFRIQN
jgi:hypothetical protein